MIPVPAFGRGAQSAKGLNRSQLRDVNKLRQLLDVKFVAAARAPGAVADARTGRDSERVAVRTLRQHNWDINQAADALMSSGGDAMMCVHPAASRACACRPAEIRGLFPVPGRRRRRQRGHSVCAQASRGREGRAG